MNQTENILKAISFASIKHQSQFRKGKTKVPYINHPIEVTRLLWEVGQVREGSVLVAGILHDTIEDTQTSPDEIAAIFGAEVLKLVQEVSDDKSLSKEERKRLQIVNAPHKSLGAKPNQNLPINVLIFMISFILRQIGQLKGEKHTYFGLRK